MKRALLIPLLSLAAAETPWAEAIQVGTQVLYSRPSVSLGSHSGDYHAGVALESNVPARPGIILRYGNYGVSLSPIDKGFDGSPRLFSGGLSDAHSFYYGDAWGFEGYHRYARGFVSEDGTFSRPDMTLRSMSLTMYRSMGGDFHVYRMADGISETGSEPDFMLTFNVARQNLRAREALLQNAAWDSRLHEIRELNLYSASMGAGFALSTNAGGVYFDPALFVGFGVQYREWGDRPETHFDLIQSNVRMRLGYRTRGFDAGVGFENDSHRVNGKSEGADFESLLARAQLQVYL